MGRLNDKEQQQLGEDRAIKNNLANILVAVQTGKRIDAASDQYSDADVDKFLSGHFRD
jgi:hypothetical protein